ncbi:MAG: hypothetical protein ABEI98_12480 [Halorhabdus sp.]
MQDSIPTTSDGSLDYQTMTDDLGIADLEGRSSVFITDNTGVVRRVISTNLSTGSVRLRDEATGDEYTTELADLWTDWRWDDLIYVDRAFLHHNEFAVTEERRPHLEALVEYIQSERAASTDPLPNDVQTALEVMTDLLND